ncbi:MAG: hypothetical protein R2762_30835 [Bryobacteraceae bacterium]
MRTSLELPEDVYRAVKVKAAQEGRTISALVTEGIRLVLKAAPSGRSPRRVRFPLIAPNPDAPTLTQKRVSEAEAATLAEEARRVGRPLRR